MSNIYIQEPPTNGKVLLNTSVGDIDIELWSKEAPRACRNFVQLCMECYYDGTIFHRVISGFIAQGGDPTGTGHGGESIYGHPFKDEIHSRLRFVRRGLVAMANGGPNDNGSQFFFTLGTTPELMNKHTIFGKVSGNTVFNMLKLQECETDSEDRPVHPNKILRTQILANPYDDIIPRVTKRKKEGDGEKKPKSKSKATKNFKLLSFGEEAEEDEEQVMKVTEGWKGKSKSSHDLTNDPRLSAVPVMEMEEPPPKKVKEEKKSDDKKLEKAEDKKSGKLDESSDDRTADDKRTERSDDRRSNKSDEKRSGRWDKSPERSDNKRPDDKLSERLDEKRSDDKRLERSDDRRSERSDDKRSERSEDKRLERSDGKKSERSDDRRSERSYDKRSERSRDNRSEERRLEVKKSDEKRSDEKRKEDKKLEDKRPAENSDEDPEEAREREERRENIRKKLKRDNETAEKDKRVEKTENAEPKPSSKSDELKQEAKQLKKEIRESKKREEQRKAGNEENNKTDPDDVPPSSNDPLADFKRERQKYKNLRKQQGGKGQSREEVTLSLLEKFKNKLNSAKTLAGDYSDDEDDKGMEEEDDASDLSWMSHKLHFDDKHHKVLDANVTDVERYEIFDPRNPLTKRRRDESKKTMKDKR